MEPMIHGLDINQPPLQQLAPHSLCIVHPSTMHLPFKSPWVFSFSALIVHPRRLPWMLLFPPFQRQPHPCFAHGVYTYHRMPQTQGKACKPLLATNQTLELYQSHLGSFPHHYTPSPFPLSHMPYNPREEDLGIGEELLHQKEEEALLLLLLQQQRQKWKEKKREASA